MRPPHHEPADLRSILTEGYGVVFDSLKLETVNEVLMMGDKDVRTAKRCTFLTFYYTIIMGIYRKYSVGAHSLC